LGRQTFSVVGAGQLQVSHGQSSVSGAHAQAGQAQSPPLVRWMHSNPAAQSASAMHAVSSGWHQEPVVWHVGSVGSGHSHGGHSMSGAQDAQAQPVPLQTSSALQAQPSLQSPSAAHWTG
jgi:hypothetical protein